MIFFSSNQYGQIFKGFKSSLPFIEKHMHLNIIPPAHNLIQSLNSIYFFNYKYKKPRINFLGDHSSSMATGASSIRQYPNCKFIWIDAHPDINTYDSSYTKNYHGMSLSYLTGLNKPFYPIPFPFLINKLSYQNILYIGIRSIDSYEQKIIQDNNIQVIKTNECNHDTHNVLKKIEKFIDNQPVHISFDVDALDPEIMPCTGTPVKHGLQKNTVIQLLQFIIAKSYVHNLDISELNLDIGDESQQQISKQTILDILRETRIII